MANRHTAQAKAKGFARGGTPSLSYGNKDVASAAPVAAWISAPEAARSASLPVAVRRSPVRPR